MKASLNFDVLFKESAEIKIGDKEIIKKAALLYEFDLEKDFTGFLQTDIKLLKDKSILRNNKKFTLPEDLRNTIISKEIGLNNIAEEIRKLKIKSEFSDLLLKAIEDAQINIKTSSDTELFYLTKIADLFDKKFDLDNVKRELQRRYYFAPFKKITENFAGREKELKQINDYVDWLPKSDLISKSISFLRGVIKWYDKPPLLIQGIGGIGKSTLVSKFIIDQNNEKSGANLPFVYIDFDLPGFTITEPLNIILECLRQLSIQFSPYQGIFNEVMLSVSNMISKNSQSHQANIQSSRASSRSLIYDSTDELIKKYSWGLDKINTPILIVFDSFEEMQYRASRDEMSRFFSFIKEVSEKIPRIRPVFVGRSEISERLGDLKFEILELNEFDDRSAFALLNKYGITDKKICSLIYKSFGGNPLLLLLAADLVKKDNVAVENLIQVKEKKCEFLTSRILEQIHNPEVRQIAVPGMLVRRITPEVIQNILAEPCNLGKLEISKAEDIYSELLREVALISKSFDSNEITFRQDLRMACEKTICDKYPKESAMIRQKAIEFYFNRKSESENDEAEYYYHVLKRGEIPQALTREVYERIRTKLESSVIELPEKAQLYINTLLSSRVSNETIKNSSVVEWEQYYLSQIKRGLNSELEYLKKLDKELNTRKERSADPNSTFAVFEALLYQRLNKLSQSNDIIDRRVRLQTKEGLVDNQYFEFGFIIAQNFEYMGKYKEALSYCETALKARTTLPNEFLLMKYNFLRSRLSQRCGKKEFLNKTQFYESNSGSIEEFTDINWVFILNQDSQYEFKISTEFEATFGQLRNMLPSMKELDRYCWRRMHVNLKDIALSGKFEIVLRDFLYILEVKGSLEIRENWDIYK